MKNGKMYKILYFILQKQPVILAVFVAKNTSVTFLK